MKRPLKVLLWILALPVGLALFLVFAGAAMPREHRTGLVLHLKASPERVWELLADHAKDPEWRPEVERTVQLPDREGHPVWEDQYRGGRRMAFEDTVALRDMRLVRTLVPEPGQDKPAQDRAAFSATWTFELSPEPGGGTRLLLTEEGSIPLLFRFIAKHVIGETRIMDAYLKALAARLGESAAPQTAP